MIRFMRESDYTLILKIWQACFGDEESYIRFFWEEGLPKCRGLLCEEASMLFMLPGALAYKEERLPAEYVYAVATLPAYRGRGFASELTKYAAHIAKQEGKAALCLRPGSESLYGYYARLGFVKAFAKHEKPGKGRFEWAPPMREYLLKESELTGRDMHPQEELGGMLLPLDERAIAWLRKTKGRACLGPALE